MRFQSVLSVSASLLAVASAASNLTPRENSFHYSNFWIFGIVELTVIQRLKVCLTFPCQFKTQDGMKHTRWFGPMTTGHGRFDSPLGILPDCSIETKGMMLKMRKQH